jgi:hypothetical protein
LYANQSKTLINFVLDIFTNIPKGSMTKFQARKKIRSKAPSQYSKAGVAVLLKLLDLLRMADWRHGSIEDVFSTPKNLSQMAALTNVNRRTVKRCVAVLVKDGVITPHVHTENSYRINIDELSGLEPRFIQERREGLLFRILNAWRMRFNRWDGLSGRFHQWPIIHPAATKEGALTCACVGFCSHPIA